MNTVSYNDDKIDINLDIDRSNYHKPDRLHETSYKRMSACASKRKAELAECGCGIGRGTPECKPVRESIRYSLKQEAHAPQGWERVTSAMG